MLPLIFNLALTPFVIHGLGVGIYGIFLLVMVIQQFIGSVDGGVGPSARRYFGMYAGRGDRAGDDVPAGHARRPRGRVRGCDLQHLLRRGAVDHGVLPRDGGGPRRRRVPAARDDHHRRRVPGARAVHAGAADHQPVQGAGARRPARLLRLRHDDGDHGEQRPRPRRCRLGLHRPAGAAIAAGAADGIAAPRPARRPLRPVQPAEGVLRLRLEAAGLRRPLRRRRSGRRDLRRAVRGPADDGLRNRRQLRRHAPRRPHERLRADRDQHRPVAGGSRTGRGDPGGRPHPAALGAVRRRLDRRRGAGLLLRCHRVAAPRFGPARPGGRGRAAGARGDPA